MMLKKMLKLAVFALWAHLLISCNAPTSLSYTSNAKFNKTILGSLEKKNINYQGVYRNPIILVHGFLGSNLIDKKTGVNVWGNFFGINGFRMSNFRLRSLALPMRLGVPLNDLPQFTVPGKMLDTVDVKILGVSFKEKAYINLVNLLQDGGFQSEDQPMRMGRTYNTLFQFSYDWRRDLQWNAMKLHEFILTKRAYIQEQYKIRYGIDNYDVQFDLMGHSMGGLVSRYYMRYGTADLPAEGEKPNVTWAGSKYVDRVVIIGTPNAGYLDTIIEMTKGLDLPACPPAVLGTWATYYQMMPVPSRRSVVYADNPDKAVDMFDVNVWIKMKWGLANPKADNVLKVLLPEIKDVKERRKIAIGHLTKCLKRAKLFIEVMAVKSTPPKDVKMFLIMGNALHTTRRAKADSKTGALTVIETAAGDGKVTRSSAIFDERAGERWTPFVRSPIGWRVMIQLRAAHMGLTTDPVFKDNILFLLNSLPTDVQMKQLKQAASEN